MSRDLPVGTRVRHQGEQFPRAYAEGTATVVDTTYPHGDEYQVLRDEPLHLGGPLLTWWPHHHTVAVQAEPRRCRWFASCSELATHDEPHSILGSVPACDRCPQVGRS
jgi:hypothetical protein